MTLKMQTEGANPSEPSSANSPPHLFFCGLLSIFPQIFDTFLMLPTPCQWRVWPSNRTKKIEHIIDVKSKTCLSTNEIYPQEHLSFFWISSSSGRFLSFLASLAIVWRNKCFFGPLRLAKIVYMCKEEMEVSGSIQSCPFFPYLFSFLCFLQFSPLFSQ